MRSRVWIIAGVVSLGAVPVAWWLYQQARHVQLGKVSDEWRATAEYDREGFTD